MYEFLIGELKIKDGDSSPKLKTSEFSRLGLYKTLLIEELLKKGTKVALISRMRRFGKTLNLSMLRYFFEKSTQDTSYLFKDLKIWQKAFDLDLQVRALTKKYPKEEKYALVSQSRRSANSVIANTAEAHGRYHFKDKIRIYYIVRGEIEETQSHLWVAYSQKYIEKKRWLGLEKRYEKVKIRVNNQINDWHNQDKKK